MTPTPEQCDRDAAGLKPCPFACGLHGGPKLSSWLIGTAEELGTQNDQWGYAVRCQCGAQGPEGITSGQAINFWNRLSATRLAAAQGQMVKSPLRKLAEKRLAEDDDHIVAQGSDSDWLAAQLACWPERVHPDRTTNDRFLRLSAVATMFDMSHRLAALEREKGELREDAERWRALLSTGRIRVLGSANVPDESPTNWVHFGAEFWSSYPRENIDNSYGRQCLTTLADRVRARATLESPTA